MVIVENTKIWLLAYPDDNVLIANKEEELTAIMKRLNHFIDSRELDLNVSKSPR